jgi:hypothetical protein
VIIDIPKGIFVYVGPVEDDLTLLHPAIGV